jgi:putative aldouronate transport system substrate-binding protein
MKKFYVLLLVLLFSSMVLFAGGRSQQSSGVNESGYDKIRMTYATVQAHEGFNYNIGDPFAAWWSKKFNYELDVAALGWDNWAERLRIWISSQDMPQIAVYDYNHADAASFVEQGLIYRFPDNWKQKWPNVAAVYAKTTLGPKLEELYKGTYFIPRARFDTNLPGDPLPNHFSLYFRKDWAAAVGFPIKTYYTINEVLEMARLFKEKDPGKVGARLIPITGTPNNNAQLFLYRNSTHYDAFYKDTDGVYKWGAASPDTLEALKLYYRAYSTGLLDREFYTLKAEEDRAKFETTTIAGIICDQLPTAEVSARRIAFTNNTKLNADDCVGYATVLGVDGNYHQRDLINFWGTICFSPKVPKAVFERWMDVMDYACTEEGYAMTVMGLPGIDFKKEGNEYVSLVPKSVQLAGVPGDAKYPSMGYILGSVKLWDDFSFDNPNIEKKYRDESRVLYAERCKMATPLTFTKVDWDLYTYDSPNRRRVNFNYPVEFANMVTSAASERNLEERWRAWIAEQNSIIQPVLNELNARRR